MKSKKRIFIFNKQVILVRPGIIGSQLESLKHFRDQVIELEDTLKEKADPVAIFLFDLSPFTTLTSTFFGDLSNLMEMPQVEKIGLCGMTPVIFEIAKRLGIVDGKARGFQPLGRVRENLHKFRIFDSLRDGLLGLEALLEGGSK
ncbi:MAG: hypothetical protein HZA01_14390 [Nitrospinae bacterium]|nr:hypothetical protein [Nitrospinota bacterium]